jgi:hypothetical protein
MRIVRVWASIRGNCITNDGHLAAKSADSPGKLAAAVTLLVIVYHRSQAAIAADFHTWGRSLASAKESAAFAPNTQTDTQSVRRVGEQIEAQIIDAKVADETKQDSE